MSTPLVSICLPNLNTRPFLQERMESILAQSCQDWELIVCDSYSDDGSWEFFQKFKGDERVRLHQVPKAGLYAGWNECLRRATGEFVYMAPSDDTARPELLERLLVPLRKRSEIQIAVCDFQPIDAKSNPIENRDDQIRRRMFGEWLDVSSIRDGKTEFLLCACFITTWVTMTAVLFRRTLLERVGLFRTDRGSQADVEWTMRACLASDIACVPGRLATWRLHESQATPRDWSPAMIRMTLTCLESVLHDHGAGIPAAWKKVPGWERQITSYWRMRLIDHFQLYRDVMKKDRPRFWENVKKAWQQDRKLVWQEAIRGFPWPETVDMDHIQASHRLIQLFDAPWPPRSVPGEW